MRLYFDTKVRGGTTKAGSNICSEDSRQSAGGEGNILIVSEKNEKKGKKGIGKVS